MKLAIVYYLTSANENIKKSLAALAEIKSKNLEIILVDSNTSEELGEYVTNLKFQSPVKKIDIYETLGHSYSYNLAFKQTDADYIYFSNARILFTEEMIETIMKVLTSKNKCDVYTFCPNQNKITSKSSSEILLREFALKYYVFSRKFLDEKELLFVNFHHYHNYFIYDALTKAKTLGCIPIDIDEHSLTRIVYTYNIYDILTSSEMIHDLITRYDLEETEKEDTEAIVTFAILHDFLKRMIKTNTNNEAINSSINNAQKLINRLCPNYKQNKFINEHKDNKMCHYILNFQPTLKYIKKELA